MNAKLSNMVAASVVAFTAIVPGVSHAADGTIGFDGEVTSQTCTINGNGSGSNNFTVTLSKVSTTALKKDGDYAQRTPWNIALTNCTPNSGNVTVYFEPGPTVDFTTGRLKNSTGSGFATNVEVGLLNSSFQPITLGNDPKSQGVDTATIGSDGSALLKFYSQYVATGGAASAGKVQTSVMYTLNFS
ncbi:type 1 fimbrial protein [Burkholderia metallica]|uniref:fimbrial protein n=1 Tax=Burkholderia metallica TaxID=488729 RepID=UPI00157A2CE1|nr:fimbrial protein [Burkholderia metallica]NTZ88383.1 type 1 fimbrial protein [Burkholderia metallica]